jgi:hypothetical protein
VRSPRAPWQPEDSDLADPRNGLREQFQTLADELRIEAGQPVILPPGRARLVTSPLATGSAAEAKTIGEGSGRLLGGEGDGCASCCGHDDINLQRNQFCRESGEPLGLPFGISVFDHEVATLDVPEVTQPLTEGLLQVGVSAQPVRQVAYASDLGRLLGLGGKRSSKKYPGSDQEVPALDSVHASPPGRIAGKSTLQRLLRVDSVIRT